ncbi:MAG: DUF2306 domain-containing protein [Paucibacter sp.]|nr:DUF2306 domain-containing protein [Roseateles sp.]MBV8380477.1 DUF2306 domain-containing protein [Roseateles sp.]
MPSRTVVGLCAVVVVAFGLLAVEHGFALAAGRRDLFSQLLAWLVSDAFVFGPDSLLRSVQPYYDAAYVRIGLHMALGGTAVSLGALQFVPALRRRWRRLHRVTGFIVWVATGASMLMGMAYLVFVPMQHAASGPAFYLGLWALDLLTVFLLWQAVAAAIARDFRSHMVWMAMVYAALLTAPMLRVDWWIAGLLSDFNLRVLNLTTGAFVFLQTTLLMGLWLTRVGDRDLPARKAGDSVWPRWLVLGISAVTALSAFQEGLLTPQGIADVFSAWRSSGDKLPVGYGACWALSTIAAMATVPRNWKCLLDGQRPGPVLTCATLGVALAAAGIGMHADPTVPAHLASGWFLVSYAAFLVIGLALAHRAAPATTGRNAWGLTTLAALWLPSQLPVLLVLGLSVGTTFAEAMTQALVNGVGGVIVAGLATGFGAKLRFLVTLNRRRPALDAKAAASA